MVLSRFVENRLAATATRGGVLYVYLLLAHPYLFLDHGALLGNDLLLGHRHYDLVLVDLARGGIPALLHGHPLHVDLLVPGVHP